MIVVVQLPTSIGRSKRGVEVEELFVRVTSKCCGYTLCADICPEVFSLDDAGFAQALPDSVPSPLWDRVRDACDNCPESAIEVSEAPFKVE